MSIKINHSSWKKFVTCPYSYHLHFNERLRPTKTSSALVFGTAVDMAINALLTKSGDPFDTFKNNFEFAQMENVVFDYRDFQRSIFTAEQLVKIDGESNDYKAWASLRIKGRLLLEAYKIHILPEIEEIVESQVSLVDRPGTPDAIVKLKGHGLVVLDNKTSARAYNPDQIQWDTQLTSYAASKGLTKGAFAVMIKDIGTLVDRVCQKCKYNGSRVRHKTCPNKVEGKRCHGNWIETSRPVAQVQLIVDDITETAKNNMDASLADVTKLVESGCFYKNLSACGMIYGKPCVYSNYCWKGDKTGLRYSPPEEGR
jgi:hypothetical protein